MTSMIESFVFLLYVSSTKQLMCVKAIKARVLSTRQELGTWPENATCDIPDSMPRRRSSLRGNTPPQELEHQVASHTLSGSNARLPSRMCLYLAMLLAVFTAIVMFHTAC